MISGKAFDVTVGTVSAGIIYTSHFVEEYHLKYKFRPPVANSVPEERVRVMIEEAIPQIEEIRSAVPEFSGVIISHGTHLNMSFSVRPHNGGFTLVMQNMMLKAGYSRKNINDYIIKVNPVYVIGFARSIDPEIRVAVIENIGQSAEEFEEGAYYTVGTEGGLVRFGVERIGNRFEVDFAEWTHDMLYVPVVR